LKDCQSLPENSKPLGDKFSGYHTLVKSESVYGCKGTEPKISVHQHTWTQKGGRVTVPSGAATLRVYVYNEMGSGWVNFDDVSVRKVSTYDLTYDAMQVCLPTA
jgi:hypothetical protein